MKLADIKRKTSDAYNMDCIYIANKNNYRHCVSSKCFYWNDLDTHVVKANIVFSDTITTYIQDPNKLGAYEISEGRLQYTIVNKLMQTREVKVVEEYKQDFFKELVKRCKTDYSKDVFFDEEEQLFYKRQDIDERVGYCMKVAKELELL